MTYYMFYNFYLEPAIVEPDPNLWFVTTNLIHLMSDP